MAEANTIDTLNGLFKEVYADKVQDLIPDGVKLINKVKFQSGDKQLGNGFNQPVVLGMEHGVTFAGEGEDAFTLNNAVSGQVKNARIRGTQLVLRSVMGYAAASRSVSSKNAFVQSTKFLVSNMLRSITKKLEIEMLYGQVGYGDVASATDAPNTIVITDAEWAPGIWAGAENMPIEVRSADGLTSRGTFNITAVDFDTKTITLDAAPVVAGVIATDVIHHLGAYGKEFAGVHKILTNTGTLFDIDAAQYTLWKGNSYNVAGTLSFAKIQEAVARGVEKGLDSDVAVMINPKAWADLLTEQTALRQYDSSYSSSVSESGSKEIKFHGQNGMIEIVPSIYVKEGYGYILSMDEMVRIGSTEVTFKRPGKGDEFFRELDGAAGYELRAYTDQALFCHAPGRNVLLYGIS